MKSLFALTAAMAVLVFAGDARANCGECGAKGAGAEKSANASCSAETCSAAKCSSEACSAGACTAELCSVAQCGSSKGCPIAAAMERLPKLTFAVGEKKTCCPKEAAKLAKESGGHVHYCVGEKQFDCKSKAQAALVESTEKFVATFTKPHSCPKSGQLTLAGHVQGCEKSAARTAELMQDAMKEVKLTYLVGDKKCACPVKAEKLAEEAGEETQFVVGDEKTCCEQTARLNLARAKYKAAVEALIRAQAAADSAAAEAGAGS